MQSIPQQADPVEPVAADTARLVQKHSCTVVQGRMSCEDDDKKSVGAK